MPFGELLERAQGRLKQREGEREHGREGDGESGRQECLPHEKEAETLGRSLLQFYTQASTSLVEFWLAPPRFTIPISDRPVASPLARRQAELCERVTNLRHETAHLGDFERRVLQLLDGSRDRAALKDAVFDLVERGELTVELDGRRVEDSGRLRAVVGQAMDAQLKAISGHSILVR
jgi:methyltransferase-like protein